MNIQTSQWEVVGELMPTRLPGVEFFERIVRGESWLFIHNDITGQHARVNALARQVVLALDGESSVLSIVSSLTSSSDQDEKEAVASSLIALSQLGMIGLGDSNASYRIQHRFSELQNQKRPGWKNPLAIRLPLIDPNEWLNRWSARMMPLLSRWMLVLVTAFLIFSIVVACLHYSDIFNQLLVFANTPEQWWYLLLVYPVLKGAHELAHAFTIKRLGGSIHEAGITVLVLMPVPYVDATDIWRFESRGHRMLVSASGMFAEGLIACTGEFKFCSSVDWIVEYVGSKCQSAIKV